MQKVRNTVNKVAETLSVVILGIMTLLVTWQVVTRYVLNSPSTMTEAMAKYLFVWLVMITGAYVIGKREHMALEFLVNKMDYKKQIICGIISEIVIILFVLIVLTYGGGYIAVNAMSQTDSALPIPIGIVYLALPTGGILSAVYAVCNVADLVKELKEKRGK